MQEGLLFLTKPIEGRHFQMEIWGTRSLRLKEMAPSVVKSTGCSSRDDQGSIPSTHMTAHNCL